MRFYSAIEPKPGRSFCEDVAGYSNGFYWLLDGATPPSETSSSILTQRFLNRITLHLTRLSTESAIQNTQQLLSQAIRSVREDFRDTIKSEKYFPYAMAALFRLEPQSIDYLILGDVFVSIEINGESHTFCDDREKRIALAERSKVREMREAGVSEQDPLYIEARDHLIECEQAHLNKEGGFWVVSIDENASTNGLQGSFDLAPNSSIIMAASDGFARMSTHFGRPAFLGDLPHRIIAEGAAQILNELRSLEQDKTNFLTPTSSKHDDASFILLH